MEINSILRQFFDCILAEADSNQKLKNKIVNIFGQINSQVSDTINISDKPSTKEKSTDSQNAGLKAKTRTRRTAAVLKPVLILSESDEESLRKALNVLSIEQLKDIVAEESLQNKSLIMRRKNPENIIQEIINDAKKRHLKGTVFE